MKNLIPLIVIGFAVFVTYLWVTGPSREIQRTTRINEHMNFLEERLKANPSNHEALRALIDSIHSDDSFERTAAIASLGEAGSAAKSAVPNLIEALNGSDGFNSRAAAISLGQIGPAAKDAIPELIRAVQNRPNEDVGWFSAESLGSISSTNDALVLKLLMHETNSSNHDMRYSANAGLKRLKAGH